MLRWPVRGPGQPWSWAAVGNGDGQGQGAPQQRAGGPGWGLGGGWREGCFGLAWPGGRPWAPLPGESHPSSRSLVAGMLQSHFTDEETKARGSGPSPVSGSNEPTLEASPGL